MTRQTWTAAVSALLFVVSAAFIAIMPVPYVADAAGPGVELLARAGGKPPVTVSGVAPRVSQGQLVLATSSLTRPEAGLTLPEMMLAWWTPGKEVFPREAVYPAGTKPADVRAREAELLETAKAAAAASGLRQAGIEVQQVPLVRKVASQGPSVDLLKPGDFVVAVDGRSTLTTDAVLQAIQAHDIGDYVTFTVLRDQQESRVAVETVASRTQSGLPVVGVTWDTGFYHAPTVTFALDQPVGGSSGGLMLALAVYEAASPDELVGDRVVAGAGAIDGLGNVSAVSSVPERVASAEAAGASVFLLPAANCAELGELHPKVRLVPVNTLDDAVQALDALGDPSMEHLVRGCT